MKNIYRKIFFVIISVSMLLLSAAAVHAYTAEEPEISSTSEVAQLPVTVPAKPENDTCFQCHVDGSFSNIWTPSVRWVLFGAAGVALLFGIARSVSVWKTRQAWIPPSQTDN